ncbi:hypothetical protein RA27_17890 [Ruegeria sp. ANG-R]|uniref:helix-turn-helix transcriptional regulator n=1 Tax=Ruegeria sp. ANG-R TaxID=1577903 RepID=UPI00057D8A84|nr:LuxR C-terminal-related transcriptional regulator [Ruegeria sp. ANG-R]KIC39028.1 hypothetical protein RA27_17890 [Ruegeria sp. ANG-R]
MKNALIDFVDALAGLNSAEDRWNEAVVQSKLMGLDAILVGEADGIKKQIYWMNTNMPEDWITEYLEEDYMSVDAMLENLAWDAQYHIVESGRMKRAEARSDKEHALDHGLKSAGLASLVGSRFGESGKRGVYVTLCSGGSMQTAEKDSAIDLTMFAALLATSITEPIQSPANLKLQSMTQLLSQRQQEVLELLAAGYQTARIAERLKISEAAVNKHFFLARRALGASTREQALAIALKQNLINL